MDFDYALRDKNRLPLVLNVLMLRNLYRLVGIGYVVEFLKRHQVLAAKGRSVECKGDLHFHFFFVGSKCIITLHTLAIHEKLGVFILYHLPAFELVFCTHFQTVQRDRIHDCDLFASNDYFLARGFVRSSGMDFNNTLFDGYRLPVVLNVLVFSHFDRLVLVR